MEIYKGTILSIAVVLLLGACSKEDPFVDPEYTGPTGSLRTSCLTPSLPNPEGTSTRADLPSTDDFQVEITPEGKRTPVKTYRYADMPEILTLPIGDYIVTAHHGENPVAEWSSPYYSGSSKFTIEQDKVTDDVEPIVATLSNIRVTINFGPNLRGSMSADSKVIVKVGDGGVKSFDANEGRSAYFRYINDSMTLTATFEGTVDGDHITESKVYEDVAPGNHYIITFKMQGIVEDDPGTISTVLSVDTTIETVDMHYTAEGEDDQILEDDKRPNQGGDEGPEDPNPPTPPVTDKPRPSAFALEPTGEYADCKKLDLDGVNDGNDNLYCAWKIISEAEGGFQAFTVTIISETLTPGELSGVGLTDELDLINPGEFDEALSGLGFPTNLGGKSEAEFDITEFLSLMRALGEGDTRFELSVSDANGTSIFNIRLKFKE